MTETPTRSTRQRAAVTRYLDGQSAFQSAQTIYAALREGGNPIGLATVYRALQVLVDDDEVDVLRTDDGGAVYRRCGRGHHHHLVCRVCGRTVEVQDRPVARWAEKVGAEHDFADLEHQVEVFGTCAACRAAST